MNICRDDGRKILAVMAVMILAVASVGCVVSEEAEETEAVVPVLAAAYVGTVIATFIVGMYAGWTLHDVLDPSGSDLLPYSRLYAAQDIGDMLSVADGFATNAMENHAQVWSLTKEHWTRQAELEVYSQWTSGSSYDASSVLDGSHVYLNAAVMNANAVAQTNSFLSELSDYFGSMDGKDAYDGKMDMGFSLGSRALSSNGSFDWDARLLSVVDATDGAGTVYIGLIDESFIAAEGESTYRPGYIVNTGSSATLSSGSKTYTIPAGTTYLEDLEGFESGVYTVSKGSVIGGDCLVQTVGDDDSIALDAGLAMTVGGSTAMAVCDGSSVRYDGVSYDALSIVVDVTDVPSGEASKKPSPVDVTGLMSAYQSLLDRMLWIDMSAGNAAQAVWNVYSEMDSKHYGVTTLVASSNYKSAVLSSSMSEAMTLSALSQLAEWYDANGGSVEGLEIGLYSKEMDAPFVRGTVYDRYGDPLYSDVVFTPFFQKEDVELSVGDRYTVDQGVLVSIWAPGQELSSWYSSGMSTAAANTVMLTDGYIAVTQLATCSSEGMTNRSSIDLDVNRVSYIEAERIDITPAPDPQPEEDHGWFTIAVVVCGAIVAVVGLVRRDPVLIIAGAAVAVFGILFADTVYEWVEGLL